LFAPGENLMENAEKFKDFQFEIKRIDEKSGAISGI
jgi:hypothetical protein